MEHELKATENENQVLKEHILRQELYSRRDNLIFEGIKEEADQTTEAVLKRFLSSVLGFKAEECHNLLISRCHRMGKVQGKDQPKAIIVHFVLDKDKSNIWQKRSLLKNTSYVIRKNYPIEITNRRKLMYPLFLEARKKDPESRLVADKVICKKKSYSYQQSQDLAQLLSFFNKGVLKGNHHLAFHGRTSIYSNFLPCTIRIKGTKYNSTNMNNACSMEMLRLQEV